MVVPLRDATGPVGTLLVANRLGDVGGFGGQDRTLLQTLAGYAGVALERSRLSTTYARRPPSGSTRRSTTRSPAWPTTERQNLTGSWSPCPSRPSG